MMNVEEAIKLYELDYISYAIKHDSFWVESAKLSVSKPGKIDVLICSEPIRPEVDLYLEDNGDEYYLKNWLELVEEGNRKLQAFDGEGHILPDSVVVTCSTWLDECVGKKVISDYIVEFTLQCNIQLREDTEYSIVSAMDSQDIEMFYEFDNLQEGFYLVAWDDNYSYIYYGEDFSKTNYHPDREDFDYSVYDEIKKEYFNISLCLDDEDQQWVNYTAIWSVLEGKASEISFDKVSQIEDENDLENIADFMKKKGIQEFTVWKI